MRPLRDIVDYAVYVPHSAITRKEIGSALARQGGAGVRSVASYDEDAITLGVAAATRLTDPSAADLPVIFGSANFPYLDKTNANVVKAALGGDSWVTTTDMGGLRAGFTALTTAAAVGGVAVMGDLKSGRPGSQDEMDGGDGGAAFVFGDSEAPIARILATASVSLELMDTWRVPGESHSRVWEERFSQHVLSKRIADVVAEIAKDSEFTDTPTYTLVSSPSARFAGNSARSIGFTAEEDLLAQHRGHVGYCGAADIGLLLGRALDVGKVGDRVLLINAVGGVDALLVEVLRDGPGSAASDAALARRRQISYVDFLTFRGLIRREPSRRPERAPVAAPAAFRNTPWKFALVGGRCEVCDKVYLPAQRVCAGCGSTDKAVPYPVSDRKAVVKAITTDGVSDSPAPPAVVAMVDFDGGGRLTVEVADSAGAEIRIGDVVEMSFRRTYEVDSGPNYFWKARLVMQGEAQ